MSHIRFEVTGSAAHSRIKPLVPDTWCDASPFVEAHKQGEDGDGKSKGCVDFVWENVHESMRTKAYRDGAKCYSHLPNGRILDDKWALGRLMKDTAESLETHCFRGLDGYRTFCRRVDLSAHHQPWTNDLKTDLNTGESASRSQVDHLDLQDINEGLRNVWMESGGKQGGVDASRSAGDLFDRLCHKFATEMASCDPSSSINMWVIKDATCNGAGGVWIVSPKNVEKFARDRWGLPAAQVHKCSTHQILLKDDQRRYVAQKYAWPPILYQQRKCHVRVYALVTADGSAYVHKRAFLHVANEPFHLSNSSSSWDEDATSMHITNCCANSDDPHKFAGEICADFELYDMDSKNCSFDDVTNHEHQNVVSLAPFFPSVSRAVRTLARESSPFLQGGTANGGFEYLGLDFILSYTMQPQQDTHPPQNVNSAVDHDHKDASKALLPPRLIPLAYLLEVNAPPSQDTATGLSHAENLHNDVIGDLLSLWVIPCVTQEQAKPGGWRRVYHPQGENNQSKQLPLSSPSTQIIPSKSAILNKMRWAMFELKCVKSYEEYWVSLEAGLHRSSDESQQNQSNLTFDVAYAQKYARSCFPYFASPLSSSSSAKPKNNPPIFFENGGGSQVPCEVIREVRRSLSSRHRDIIGRCSERFARKTFATIMGVSLPTRNTVDDKTTEHTPSVELSSQTPYVVFLGCNASTLLASLAGRYAVSGVLSKGDEIIIARHNHEANVRPWLDAANQAGATVRWWNLSYPSSRCSIQGAKEDIPSYLAELQQVLTPSTKIVAMAHASNVLGYLYDVRRIAEYIRSVTSGKARLVVDGVASAPHCHPDVAASQADWYVISCHKMFGPHIAGMAGRVEAVEEIRGSRSGWDLEFKEPSMSFSIAPGRFHQLLERGTINFEACAGVSGLGRYLLKLARMKPDGGDGTLYNCDDELIRATSEAQESETCLTEQDVVEVYSRIGKMEAPLVRQLLSFFKSCSKVTLIQESMDEDWNLARRLPIISFIHQCLKPSDIVKWCVRHGVICRHGTFLSGRCVLPLHHWHPQAHVGATGKEWSKSCDLKGGMREEGVVRLSLVHYNTLGEVEKLFRVLETMNGWR